MSMITILAMAAFAFTPIALQAEQSAPLQSAPAVELSHESAALLRCSAAFALVSFGQQNGSQTAQKWPQIDPRGREFFVRALARLMDDTGLDREGVSQLASAEAQRLLDEEQVDEVMPACLLMLEASGV